MQTTTFCAWRRSRSLTETRNLSSKNIWKSQISSLSLPSLNHKSGTDAADLRRPFLYPNLSENNTTAPCRVMETSRKPRFYELRQHVAQFLFCLNHKIMATFLVNRAWRRTRSLTETRNSLNNWLDTKSSFYTRLCDLPVTRRLAIRLNLLFLCLFLAVLCVDHLPIIATIAVAYVVYGAFQLNRQTKGGEQ
jgi:hypothetical protein